jgi:DNA polymerase-3 subunit gamma/tau
MTAIYQQARPYTFDQVVGQDHVKEVLALALAKNRIGHAYLFSGPRGVGKTTTARLIAMAVNCERASEVQPPCGECGSCMAVRQNSHPDVIELDAASNNSVEDVRELREKVNLSAIRGGSRVWILDEAHMLTKSAANALLKTLEEPPSNLVFILATTEPEKLPPTILSRCQHFRFRRLSDTEIASKLTRLCDIAGVEAEPEALSLVARAADGAMRDGESLLERLLVSGKKINRQDAEDALGLPPQERLQALAQSLVHGDLEQLFTAAADLYRAGFAPRSLAERLLMTLRDALYANLGLEGYAFTLPLEETAMLRLIHALDDESDRFVRHDDLFSLEVALIKAYNALQNNVPADAVAEVIPQQTRQATAPAQTAQPSKPAVPDFDPHGSGSTPPARARPTAAERTKQAPPPQAKSAPSIDWHTIQTKAGVRLKAFMQPAEAEVNGDTLVLTFADHYKFHFEQLKRHEDKLGDLVNTLYGDRVTLEIRGPGKALRIAGGTAEPSTNPEVVTKKP